MRIYDAAGRLKISALWAAISGVPTRVKEIEVLVDPNERQYVGWNDVSNQLELFAFDALDIPYDNTSSGLTATNVQDAIDEIEAAATPTTFFGYVDDFASANQLPAGWTVTRTAVGTYTVTHSLGLSDIRDLSFVALAENSRAEWFSNGLNSIRVRIQVTPDTDVDRNWMFIAGLNV